jgi:hypothetical protein
VPNKIDFNTHVHGLTESPLRRLYGMDERKKKNNNNEKKKLLKYIINNK